MNRSMWISGCAVCAVWLMPLFAAGQQEDDPFGPSAQATVENPFEDGALRTPAEIDRSLIATPESPPAEEHGHEQQHQHASAEHGHEHEHQHGPAAIDRSLIATRASQPAQGPVAHTDWCRCVGENESESMAKIEEALRGRLTSTGLDFNDAPLEEVVGFLQETYSIPIQLDEPALEEIGISPDEPVTVNVHGISLRSALRLMLKQFQLTYIIRDEVLTITTPEDAESNLITCVYDVRDIVESWPPERGPMGASAYADFNPLVDVIQSCINKETWSEHGGGQGDLRPLRSGLLVVSQTQAVQEQIRGLLETIRNLQQDSPVRADADARKSAAADSDPNKVVTRAYILNIGQPANPEDVRKQIYELITQSLPDEQFQRRLDDGQPVVLTVMPDRVVVRHKPSVQEKVEQLLSDSGLASPPSPAGAMSGPGGFGGGGFFSVRPTANSSD